MTLNAATVIAAGVFWLGLLFGIALYGERHPDFLKRRWAIVYTLSLGVHCTSWTFYGTITQASRSGWWLPPTFVGVIALYLAGIAVIVRLVRLAQEYNASSLADLIAARLGRSSGLAALVTAVTLLGIVPYIALQLKAVAMSYGILVYHDQGQPAWQDSALYVALLMALFAMLFGTRRASAVAHNRGLVLAVAFESVFKLVAMLALGTLALGADLSANGDVARVPDTDGFPALILLGALAMFTMPHQFHTGVVECRDANDVRVSRWLFPLYILLISLPILPLARLGDARFALAGVKPDLYMLALPLTEGRNGLALFAFLGGLSAATSMVIVATYALSLMIANHFVAPLRARGGWMRSRGDLRVEVLNQRRAAILGVLLLAWVYSRALVGNNALADIGAQSFAALAALAPGALVAIWMPQIGARPVVCGIAAGLAVWLYVLLPGVFAPYAPWTSHGPFGFDLLAPANLLGLGEWSVQTRAVALGLAANLAAVAAVVWFERDRKAIEVAQRPPERRRLRALAARFLLAERVEALFAGAGEDAVVDEATLAGVTHELAAVIGASSARLLIDALRRARGGELDTVAAIVGEASQDLRFNQRVLEAALENMSQGICVVDAQLCVVAWNRPYERMFDYPPGLLAPGRAVAELMRHNIERGVIGEGDIERRLHERVDHMRAGTPHVSERRFPNGRVIEIRGNPMPGGGYVATFADVTAFREAERALTRANETLEQRVAERTGELERATLDAERARHDAERANQTKSRFLAAVGHDLMQPLHAAQLFAHTIAAQHAGTGHAQTPRRLLGALAATESLLGGLHDIAGLEGGRLHVQAREFALDELLSPLAGEFAALAAERGLRLDYVRTRAWVRSDPQLLRRVLQNFLSNALRHAARGRVLLGCRRCGDELRIDVIDTGQGVPEHERELIFEEFRRGSGASGQGLGLGLAIAERIARLLAHPLSLRSWPGRGCAFSVRLPRAGAQAVAAAEPAPQSVPALRPATALLVDNEPQALSALATLLESWGWQVRCAQDEVQALSAANEAQPDVAILDYHLDGGGNGIDLHARLRDVLGERRAILLTADRDTGLRQRARAAGLVLLYKPLKPFALHQALRQMRGA
ncbi:MAG: PAS-domain containing protein [Proteobacteria bacterium]|uniref:hybrid sensor histidine kinase/response regulator n=1 Tax=Rudaea sp. TaxID=2136325 RepID=UPI0032201232|nr:PAS-domain containing protein [Pseudomonadota bacterium]